jgi:hypothetical protein
MDLSFQQEHVSHQLLVAPKGVMGGCLEQRDWPASSVGVPLWREEYDSGLTTRPDRIRQVGPEIPWSNWKL